MATKNDELLKRLLATFRVEADELIKAIVAGLLALEKDLAGPEVAHIVETVFRHVHSLKGAARAVNLEAVGATCQSLESVFAALKSGRIPVSVPLLDLLHQTIDGLGAMLVNVSGTPSTIQPAVAALIRQLDQAASGVPPSPTTGTAPAGGAHAAGVSLHMPSAAPSTGTGTVRIASEKLDAVVRQVEELLMPRLATRQRALELRNTAAAVAAWKKERSQILPILRHIERSAVRRNGGNGAANGRKEFLKVLDHLDREHLFIATLEERLAGLNKSAARDQRTLTSMTDSLLQVVKEMQLLPFASLIEVLPRLARELARDQGKEVDLVVHGSEIEIDRRILDELKDPLIHLLRNAIDHGIETPAARAGAGKPSHGTVTLAVSQRDGGKIEVLLADDGAGVDGERVRQAARKLGMLTGEEDQALSKREELSLIFLSGVSTSPIVTDVSGRGLGLAIVREKVERLGGSVAIESQSGTGTTFRIVLPLSMATFRGILVRIGEWHFVIPSAGVERVARVAVQAIQTVENRETIMLDAQVISLAGLGAVLELPGTPASETLTHAPVIVLSQGQARVAFRVDEILGEQEILVKNLGPQLARVRNVAGASMLGTGQVVPVLNVADLLKSAVRSVAAPRAPAAVELPASGTKRSILVAEDSITSRALLKNILESAGYAVATAVDGMDAFTALKTADFDLLVSDVEMPRMDGFDLTAKVRADKQLAELPVVLVTALESREHRERGIDVGANAYIVKSSFDQSNLLEIIRRLI